MRSRLCSPPALVCVLPADPWGGVSHSVLSTFWSVTLFRCVFNHLSPRLRSPRRAAGALVPVSPRGRHPAEQHWPAFCPHRRQVCGLLAPATGEASLLPSRTPLFILGVIKPADARGGEPAGARWLPPDPGQPPGLKDELMGVCSLTQREEMSQAEEMQAERLGGSGQGRGGGAASRTGIESHWRGEDRGWGVAEASLSGLAASP